MGRSFHDDVARRAPVLDYGWRTALYPPGTTTAQALAQEILVQGEIGMTLDPLTVTRLTRYVVPTTADSLPDATGYGPPPAPDKGRRDVVALLGMTVIRFRVTGPGVHNTP